MKFAVIVFLFSTLNLFAAETASVQCTAEFSYDGFAGFTYVRRNLHKNVKIRKTIFNKNIKSLSFNEVINIDFDHSLKLSLKEVLNMSTGEIEVELSGVLARHRAGNGKVVLGENSKVLNFSNKTFDNYISLRVNNDFVRDLFPNKSVVKDAFIECSTL